MNRLTAQAFGLVLFLAGLWTLTVPPAVAFGMTIPAEDSTLRNVGTAVRSVLTAVPALAAVLAIWGSTAAVAGLARLRGGVLTARGALSVPVLAGMTAATVITLLPGSSLLALVDTGPTEVHSLVLHAAVTGGVVAPILLGTVREDTPVLVLATVLFFTGITSSPDPSISLGVGFSAGLAAVCGMAVLDSETWLP